MLPWQHPERVLPLIVALGLNELVRSGFFIAHYPHAAGAAGLSVALLGTVISTHYLVDAAAKVPMLKYYGRFGIGPMLGLAGLLGLANLYWLVDLGLLWGGLLTALWGLLVAPLWPLVMTTSSVQARPGQENMAANIGNLMIGLGTALGMLGGGYLIQTRPEWLFPILVASQIGFVLAGLVNWNFKAPALEKVIQERAYTRKVTWRTLKFWEHHGAEDAFPYASLRQLIPAAFIQMLIPALFSSVWQKFVDQAGVNAWPRTELLSVVVFAALLFVGGMLGTARLTRGGRWLVPVMLTGLGAMGAAFGLLPLLIHQGFWPLLLAVGLLGAGYGIYLSSWNGLVIRLLLPEFRAVAWSVLMTFEALGFAVGPALGGLAWTLLPFGTFFLAALFLGGTMVYYRVVFGQRPLRGTEGHHAN